LARRASEISTAITQTSTAVEELKQSAEVAGDQAKSVSQRSLQVVEIAEHGKKATDQTVERMELVRHQMETIDETVEKLAESSAAIENIIEAVQDLSDQSNLLAVNASIEAARAGDYGKGFAVVAHEIKALADQSKEATEQVAQILKEIRNWVARVATATHEGSKIVDAAVEQSIVGGESIEALSRNVAEAADAASVIDAASKQQSVGVDQVSDAMKSIEEALHHTLDYTSRLEAAASQLEELRERFDDLTAPFRV
jgi:methyl-accepting chemotaxis protein